MGGPMSYRTWPGLMMTERLRRHLAAVRQTIRMFETYGSYGDTDGRDPDPPQDPVRLNDSELEALETELEELESELNSQSED